MQRDAEKTKKRNPSRSSPSYICQHVRVTSGGTEAFWSWSCFFFLWPDMSIAYTCSHYSLTNSAARRPPGACVVFILLPGGLFIHLHNVAVDHITWPGGDSEPLGSRPAALKVRRAAQGGEVVCDESSISRSLFTVTPHHLRLFLFFSRVASLPLYAHFYPPSLFLYRDSSPFLYTNLSLLSLSSSILTFFTSSSPYQPLCPLHPHEHRFIECTPHSKLHIHTMMMISNTLSKVKIMTEKMAVWMVNYLPAGNVFTEGLCVCVSHHGRICSWRFVTQMFVCTMASQPCKMQS